MEERRGTRTRIPAAAALPILPGKDTDRFQGCGPAEKFSHRAGPHHPPEDLWELYATPADADGRDQAGSDDRHAGLFGGSVSSPGTDPAVCLSTGATS